MNNVYIYRNTLDTSTMSEHLEEHMMDTHSTENTNFRFLTPQRIQCICCITTSTVPPLLSG